MVVQSRRISGQTALKLASRSASGVCWKVLVHSLDICLKSDHILTFVDHLCQRVDHLMGAGWTEILVHRGHGSWCSSLRSWHGVDTAIHTAFYMSQWLDLNLGRQLAPGAESWLSVTSIVSWFVGWLDLRNILFSHIYTSWHIGIVVPVVLPVLFTVCITNVQTCSYWHPHHHGLQAITLRQLSRDVSGPWGAILCDCHWSTSKLHSAVCSNHETHWNLQACLTWSASITGKRVCQRQTLRPSSQQDRLCYPPEMGYSFINSCLTGL
jgi:hypothetical protein